MIKCDLYGQWINAMRQEFDAARFDHSALDDRNCAIVWCAWSRRPVSSGPRQILRSRGFQCPKALQYGLDGLEKALRDGEPLWPWQSKTIDKVTREDGMLNDFGVIHFHLGAKREKNGPGYMERTGELLFARIEPDRIYEIGIYQHGDWCELDILETMDRDWPALLEPVAVLDVTGEELSASDLKTLRAKGANVMVQLKSGRVVSSLGGGIMSSGVSAKAVRDADRTGDAILQGEKLIREEIQGKIDSGELKHVDYHVRLCVIDSQIYGELDGHAWRLL